MASIPAAPSLGVPVGTLHGKAVGWQLTFGIVTIQTGLLIIWALWKLPNFSGQKAEDRVPCNRMLRRTVCAPSSL
ncbi:hypothetical protein [Streptomyces camponoticapitis]|nr:hypothetical protein [Streptomyces camponoticapitis]